MPASRALILAVAAFLAVAHSSRAASAADSAKPQAPAKPAAPLVALKSIRGVTATEGHPAAAAEVRVFGMGYEIDNFDKRVSCDAKGQFELGVLPNKYYTFAARRGQERSGFEKRVIRSGMPVDPIKLVLKPGTRVSGRLTRGQANSPVAQQTIALRLGFDNDYEKLPDQQKLPRPEGRRRRIGPLWVEETRTDAEGRFEFLVAPGSYLLTFRHEPLEVKDQKALVVDVVDRRPNRKTLKGRVVWQSDPSRGVSGAKVEGASKAQIGPRPDFLSGFRVVADRDGNFEASRGETNMVVWAQSGSLAGAVTIKPSDKTAVVALAPTASATGTLISDATGKPAANKEVRFGVRLPEAQPGSSPVGWRWYFQQSATTDATGRFTVQGLTLGLKYDAYAEMERNKEEPAFLDTLTAVVPKNAERIDLGELKLHFAYQAEIERRMNSQEPLDTRLQSALFDARPFENRVLIFAARPKSQACRRYFAILSFNGDQTARETVANDFTRLDVDPQAHGRDADVKTFLARWSLTTPGPDDALLAIVDRDGRLVASTTARKLSLGNDGDAEELTVFLKKHEGPVPDAEQLLADALAQARRENKRVLVEDSAAWCPGCHQLAKLLDSHRSLIEKDYIWLAIDDRFRHGTKVMRKLRPDRREGTIPWMAILDADGNPLITSDGPKGNIGYPREPKGWEHFGKMLRTTARHLSDADIKALLADGLKH